MAQDKDKADKHPRRFNDYAAHIKKQYHTRVQKLSVNAGFTCPNRDGTRGRAGCSYCNNRTFRPAYCEPEKSITRQINEGIRFFEKKYKKISYVAYFQSFSNTYAPLDVLKTVYSEALEHPEITGLVIGTRPDCVDDEILDYIGHLAETNLVTIEYGVESTRNETLQRINRHHDFETSEKAIRETHKRNIKTGAHLILGLPGETRTDMIGHAAKLSALPLDSLKLHQLQITEGTVMAGQYRNASEEFTIFEVDEYIDLVIEFLEHLNPGIAIERFASQAPKDFLIAPQWGLKNFEIAHRIERRMDEVDTWQGKKYTP